MARHCWLGVEKGIRPVKEPMTVIPSDSVSGDLAQPGLTLGKKAGETEIQNSSGMKGAQPEHDMTQLNKLTFT